MGNLTCMARLAQNDTHKKDLDSRVLTHFIYPRNLTLIWVGVVLVQTVTLFVPNADVCGFIKNSKFYLVWQASSFCLSYEFTAIIKKFLGSGPKYISNMSEIGNGD